MKNSFLKRIFEKPALVPASDPLLARVEALERNLKNAIIEWDDALDQLQRLAGRASKLKGLNDGGARGEPPMTDAEKINRRILMQRAGIKVNGEH